MATNSVTPTKVTSLGSQYSVSASDDVTVPNPTPRTEALDDEVVDPPPEIDFVAMSKTLATIAETLNESADEAMFPTPPINTPVITSPATSVVHRHSFARSRGMSTIGDRLARVVAEDRKLAHRDSETISGSSRSIRSSVPATDESDGGFSVLLGGGGKEKQEIPIALGSPRINPLGLISFTSNDLADRAPVPFNSTEPIEDASATGIGSGSHHPNSQISLVSADTGVTEMSNWKEEVEGYFERAVQRLENLAHDEHQQDPSRPMEYYYEAHLKRLLGIGSRRIPVSVNLVIDSQQQ
ncbi:uncharacterized protein EKO05_0000442 [Ascochyta rabiei]|nr:uncharacterized protein EKO05_0000442 [Ascochyta rabiei]UPX09759.1 hypothetical protein EKO05_0000442 [Ascochyta rabiei]